jgi:hypothetical protein
MPHFTPLNLKDFTFSELFQADSLNRLDQQFIEYLQRCNASWSDRLLNYRHGNHPLSPLDLSELLLACAPVLEAFLAELFNLQTALETSRQNTLSQQAVFDFKKWFVLRRAKRRIREKNVEESFAQLDAWLKQAEEKEANFREVEKSEGPLDRELSVSHLAQRYLADNPLVCLSPDHARRTSYRYPLGQFSLTSTS